MHTHWLNETITYTGAELRPHWIFEKSGRIGDAIVSFAGPADVPTANMADIADVRDNAPILSKAMLHFIAEHFDTNLELAIARQRLLVAIALEELMNRGVKARRSGNDLFDGDRKLSVSIATASPVSTLIHFAINIKSDGTPVPTKGLADYNIEPKAFTDTILQRYADEIASMRTARCKVRCV